LMKGPKASVWKDNDAWKDKTRGVLKTRSFLKTCGEAGPECQFNNNYFAEMRSGSEGGSYLRLIDLCITQLWAREKQRRRKSRTWVSMAAAFDERVESHRVDGARTDDLSRAVFAAMQWIRVCRSSTKKSLSQVKLVRQDLGVNGRGVDLEPRHRVQG